MIILKEKLDFGTKRLEMPVGAEIISVGAQKGEYCEFVFWHKNETPLTEEREFRRFVVIPTGQEFDGVAKSYIGTATDFDGFAGHIFELELQ